ncbi:hypothetical protein ACFXHD_15060 [Streptomyces hydrogenans]|uniref:hypothetical protein n=1 Tax=Streptomyces hydrogenans TaxID=1873719 RepID=UPI00368FA534
MDDQLGALGLVLDAIALDAECGGVDLPLRAVAPYGRGGRDESEQDAQSVPGAGDRVALQALGQGEQVREGAGLTLRTEGDGACGGDGHQKGDTEAAPHPDRPPLRRPRRPTEGRGTRGPG